MLQHLTVISSVHALNSCLCVDASLRISSVTPAKRKTSEITLVSYEIFVV